MATFAIDLLASTGSTENIKLLSAKAVKRPCCTAVTCQRVAPLEGVVLVQILVVREVVHALLVVAPRCHATT